MSSNKTYNQVLRDKTLEYLQNINLASPPPPDEIEYTILHKVYYGSSKSNLHLQAVRQDF